MPPYHTHHGTPGYMPPYYLPTMVHPGTPWGTVGWCWSCGSYVM